MYCGVSPILIDSEQSKMELVMTQEKVLEVINHYRRLFEKRGIKKIKSPHDQLPESPELALAHCHNMLDTIETFVREGRMGKTFRWLGFIQGVLWALGIYPLTELKDHNRPSSDPSFEEAFLTRLELNVGTMVADIIAAHKEGTPPVPKAIQRVRREESPAGDCGVGCGCGFCN